MQDDTSGDMLSAEESRRLTAFEEAVSHETPPMPSPEEWDDIGERLRRAPRPYLGEVRTLASPSFMSGPLAPLLAASLLVVAVLLFVPNPVGAPIEESVARSVEIHEVPAESQVMVYNPAEPGGAVVVFISARDQG